MPTLAVKVPFARKLGAVLNGYRIGTYLAERPAASAAEANAIDGAAGQADVDVEGLIRRIDIALGADGQLL